MIRVRSHRAALLRVTIAAWLRAAIGVPRLVPDPLKAGVGKQNAVGGRLPMVVVVRRGRS
jgi:hypothetical protein